MSDFTRVEEILPLTEALLGLEFSTDEEEDRYVVENSDDGLDVVVFSPSRIAAPMSDADTAADRVSSFWAGHGYTPVRSVEEESGSLIVDAYTERGDMISCSLSPACTILHGESAPEPAA